MLILIFSVINFQNNYIKFAYLLFIIHSFIDLNFSYMFGIYTFGILLGLLDAKKTMYLKNKYIFYIYSMLALILLFIQLVIVI